MRLFLLQLFLLGLEFVFLLKLQGTGTADGRQDWCQIGVGNPSRKADVTMDTRQNQCQDDGPPRKAECPRRRGTYNTRTSNSRFSCSWCSSERIFPSTANVGADVISPRLVRALQRPNAVPWRSPAPHSRFEACGVLYAVGLPVTEAEPKGRKELDAKRE